MGGEPSTIVIFGATGDLTKTKLIPALSDLHKKKKLHTNTKIVAIGRRDFSDVDIRKYLGVRGPFAKRIKYHKLEFDNADAYVRLKKLLDSLPKSIRNNRLFYLATPQTAFSQVVDHLSKLKIAERMPREGWHRVVFEKPFGSDLKSAKKLNRTITKLFHERQIYRIDHYVGKSLVQELLVLRFSNPVFEHLWNSKYVSRVQIEVMEQEGVGSRAGYYDNSGALRDMIQNHLLQLLSLVAMEDPLYMTATQIRNEKASVLKSVVRESKRKLRENLVCAQYEGYRNEKGVKKFSQTETYTAVKLEINNKRWKGTPFYLATGKALKNRYAEIVLTFKSDSCPLFQDKNHSCGENTLIIRIQPDEGVCFIFNLADDKSVKKITPHTMEYSHEATAMNTPEAYELLLFEAIGGDQTLFTRWDFVEYSWRIVDNLRRGCNHLDFYKKGSEGPFKGLRMLQRKHRKIRS